MLSDPGRVLSYVDTWSLVQSIRGIRYVKGLILLAKNLSN